MIFDGFKFRQARTVATLPVKDENGNLMPYVKDGFEHYIHFGKIVKQGETGKDAVRTSWTWNDVDKSPVYAVPFKDQRHSLTNMAYVGSNVYLVKDAKVYSAKRKTT